jgi:hypothetical protein
MHKQIRQSRWMRGEVRDTSVPPRGRANVSASKLSQPNAKREYERYLGLANATAANGDAVETENCYQHAEHYFRLMREPAV